MQLVEEVKLDIRDFCDIVGELLSQSDSKSQVWCVVDGVFFFETSSHGWKDDMAVVMDYFIECVANAVRAIKRHYWAIQMKQGAAVKVLVVVEYNS